MSERRVRQLAAVWEAERLARRVGGVWWLERGAGGLEVARRREAST